MEFNANRYCKGKQTDDYAYYIIKETNWYAVGNQPPHRCLLMAVINEKEKKVVAIVMAWENHHDPDYKFFPDFYWSDTLSPQETSMDEAIEFFKKKIRLQDEKMEHFHIVEYISVEKMVHDFVNNVFGVKNG